MYYTLTTVHISLSNINRQLGDEQFLLLRGGVSTHIEELIENSFPVPF
jgi:hypothetical protein